MGHSRARRYNAVDAKGNTYTNCHSKGVNAVTWGVFPCQVRASSRVARVPRRALHVRLVARCTCASSRGSAPPPRDSFGPQEVQQPTVVDPAAFLVWAEEAFQLWISEWASIYDCESSSADLIHKIHDTHFLVNLVDHDFVGFVLAASDEHASRALEFAVCVLSSLLCACSRVCCVRACLVLARVPHRVLLRCAVVIFSCRLIPQLRSGAVRPLKWMVPALAAAPRAYLWSSTRDALGTRAMHTHSTYFTSAHARGRPDQPRVLMPRARAVGQAAEGSPQLVLAQRAR